ncbi:hypothetical protein [Companilactobacillus paralimentarius]|uniref:hypothetical protein n=1 Tax=Companilactobacillus paralimentarius TaxID=83526 RepID=UPI0037E0414C
MAQGISVVLDENYSKELRKQIYQLVTDEIERARKDASLDKKYLRRKEALNFSGVSGSTFDNWRIPVHKIDGITLYSKTDIVKFIESN